MKAITEWLENGSNRSLRATHGGGVWHGTLMVGEAEYIRAVAGRTSRQAIEEELETKLASECGSVLSAKGDD